tara:strand:- start:238 stop:552 length:315 start_codon:yes stop_codon:yes gene_type:complete
MLLELQDLLDQQVELELLGHQDLTDLVTVVPVELKAKVVLAEPELLEEHLVTLVEQVEQVLLETLEQQVLLDLTVIIKTVLEVVLDRLEHQDLQVLLVELPGTT